MLYIFDVDGTLVTTRSGATFRKSADDWQWLPGRLEKLRELERQGAILAIASNQGGVAFGYLDLKEIRDEMNKLAEEAHIFYVALCFSHPKATLEAYREDSPHRKPGPGMLLEIIEALGEQIEQVVMVGDRPEDEQAAGAAGVGFVWAEDFFESRA